MFKVGDKVRRKAEWQSEKGWNGGIDAIQIETISESKRYITLIGHPGDWRADKFEPAAFTLPADSFPAVEIPPQVRTGEARPTIGPVERVLMTPIAKGHSGIKDFFDACPATGWTVSRLYSEMILRFIDAEIAAERAAGNAVPGSIESYVAREKHLCDEVEQLQVQLAGCLTAAEGCTSGENLAKQADYGWSLAYQRVVDLRKKCDIQAEQIEKLANYPHDYDLLAKNCTLYQAEIEQLQSTVNRLQERRRDEQEEIDRLNDDARIRQADNDKHAADNQRLQSEIEQLRANQIVCHLPTPKWSIVPRNDIAWLIGWLNCDQCLDDPEHRSPQLEAHMKTVDAWLRGDA